MDGANMTTVKNDDKEWWIMGLALRAKVLEQDKGKGWTAKVNKILLLSLSFAATH
jgi:hypothetical protein